VKKSRPARLQPTAIGLGATQGSSSLLDLSFVYGTTANNGNLLTQTITAPGLAALTQTYSYDNVNRLDVATETPASWSRAYEYDAYGNRAATGSGVGINTPQSKDDFDPVTNRLKAAYGATYDAAGNLISFDRSGAGTIFDWSAAYDADNKQRFYCHQTTVACSTRTTPRNTPTTAADVA